MCMAWGRNHTYDAKNSNSTRSIEGAQTSFSLPENATSKQKNVSYPVLCLVLLKRVSIFDSTFRVGCLDPANRDHSKN